MGVVAFPEQKRRAHWSDEYLGLPFSEYNCAALCIFVLGEMFAKRMPAPLIPLFSQAKEMTLSEQCVMLQHAWTEFLMPVNHAVFEGDIALMKIGRLWHCGVVVMPNDQVCVLHSCQAFGSSARHSILRLPHGVKLDRERPYWRWRE